MKKYIIIISVLSVMLFSCNKENFTSKKNKIDIKVGGEKWEPTTINVYKSGDFMVVDGKGGNNEELIIKVKADSEGDYSIDEDNKVAYYDGEETYYAQIGGEISIKYLSDNGIEGKISVTMSSNAKSTFEINGDFYGFDAVSTYFQANFDGQTFTTYDLIGAADMIILDKRMLGVAAINYNDYVEELVIFYYNGPGSYNMFATDNIMTERGWISHSVGPYNIFYFNFYEGYNDDIPGNGEINIMGDENLLEGDASATLYDNATRTPHNYSATFKLPKYNFEFQ